MTSSPESHTHNFRAGHTVKGRLPLSKPSSTECLAKNSTSNSTLESSTDSAPLNITRLSSVPGTTPVHHHSVYHAPMTDSHRDRTRK
ncbi:hypothetical protein E2C01_008865 [Portunus trituberculatus]|uniref:Uncharacterized protein n=1 Tax=Portunus trituberculatus TaxID=210409 RepID=A0A5B7D4V7_PORTR|nr:hypothetical protein [Portunus trituberculatus]